MNKKILSILILLLVISFSNTAFASLTFTTDAITGTTASSIDLGAGNTLSLQTTGNGAITVGTGMITLGGSITLPATTSSSTGVIYKGADSFIHNYQPPTASLGWNTFVGLKAGNFTMAGSSAGHHGSFNTALGYNSLNGLTIGNENTAIGVETLKANTSGGYNIAIGNNALILNTTGSNNVGIGQSALRTNLIGGFNVGLGNSALQNATGSRNTGLGVATLQNNSTGDGNVAIGTYAGRYELGSNAFYVNNISQVNTAGDKAYSLLYGTFAGTAGSLTGQKLTINALTNINIAKLSVYANNAAALAGGLVAGDLYRTGADPDPIMVVH